MWAWKKRIAKPSCELDAGASCTVGRSTDMQSTDNFLEQGGEAVESNVAKFVAASSFCAKTTPRFHCPHGPRRDQCQIDVRRPDVEMVLLLLTLYLFIFHIPSASMRPSSSLCRATRHYQMTGKTGPRGYYKGTRTGSMGSHTKHGGYIVNYDKVRTYVVPDNLDTCKVRSFTSSLSLVANANHTGS